MIVAMMKMKRTSAIATATAMAMMIANKMKRNSMRTVLAMKYQMYLALCREHSVAGSLGRQII